MFEVRPFCVFFNSASPPLMFVGRILLRNTEASEKVYTERNIACLVAVTDLPKMKEHQELSVEGIKCVVNFAIRALEIERNRGNVSDSLVLRVLRGSNWAPLAFEALVGAVQQSKDSDLTFALCRLLNMVLWDADMRAQVSHRQLVDLLLDLFKHHVEGLESTKSTSADQVRFNIAGDAVRMMFQLTSEYGPLSEKNAKEAKAYPMTSESSKLEEKFLEESPIPEHIRHLFLESVEPLKRALLLDFHDHARRQLQLSCMTYALNLPKEQILAFDAYKVLPYLIKICEFHLNMPEFDASATATILMLFTKIVRDEPRTRALFLQAMFPRWQEILQSDQDIVAMPPQHNGTIGKRIIDCMQTSNTGLQFYSNEFVFLLCNEQAEAFTRFVGFGPGAGHLAVRGLLGMAGGGEKATNWKETKLEEPDLSNMSPEDLKEWEELMAKMNRLDELGVIKMVKKGDDEQEKKK